MYWHKWHHIFPLTCNGLEVLRRKERKYSSNSSTIFENGYLVSFHHWLWSDTGGRQIEGKPLINSTTITTLVYIHTGHEGSLNGLMTEDDVNDVVQLSQLPGVNLTKPLWEILDWNVWQCSPPSSSHERVTVGGTGFREMSRRNDDYCYVFPLIKLMSTCLHSHCIRTA